MRGSYESTPMLKLTAASGEDPEKLVRLLSGVLLASGGWVLSRATQGREVAEIDFEFVRSTCIEIYAALVASGIELSRESHYQLAELCACTRRLMREKAYGIARIDLVIYGDASARVADPELSLREV
ncbi:hypothetical protein [Silvibacterium dinghuense]|uniref:Uncharacterized protein n=1 Tax=Silvibacterium dinghuense TaxID=1560006 RepID=A0A4Q1SHA3_9BACT|nr:hypothetical protein [Silvibacterium dinghuense]RXS96550.1 hypothetical protein ESZ00_00915 [Silvibacterium dinghuense]GGG91684.1 hypothetical protein GCM10011586_02900 [Silvibacterium dinghuense]